MAFSAPNAPTLTTPTNASYQDVSAGLEFTANYNSTDGYPQNAYALRIKVSSGSYNYWNATTNALQGTIVWNAALTPFGGSWSVTIPSSAISDGNVYNWSMASQEAGAGEQGPFATDFTFTAQVIPIVTVTDPTGSVGGTDQPTIEWTNTLAPGASQVTYQAIVESGTYGPEPGSGTQEWTSGLITSAALSVVVGSALAVPVTYRAFVQISGTGGQVSDWGYSTFTLIVGVPATPIVTATPGNDPNTGYPIITVAVQGLDNYVSADDSSFEGTGSGSVGTWTAGANTSVAASDAESLDGSYSLAITAT